MLNSGVCLHLIPSLCPVSCWVVGNGRDPAGSPVLEDTDGQGDLSCQLRAVCNYPHGARAAGAAGARGHRTSLPEEKEGQEDKKEEEQEAKRRKKRRRGQEMCGWPEPTCQGKATSTHL